MQYLDILVKLRKIIRSINLESKKIEKHYGISIPQLLVLQYLSNQKEYKATAKDIKNYLNLNASTVSGILKRLETKGFLAKLPKFGDKRSTVLVLTAFGRDLLTTSPTTLQEKLSARLKKLKPEEITELDKNIELLTSLMDAEDIDASPIITSDEIPRVIK